MQLSLPSERLRGGQCNQVGAKLTVEAQLVIAENTISVGQCVIPLSKGFVSHSSVVWMVRGLFWLHMHSTWSDLNDPDTPSKVIP